MVTLDLSAGARPVVLVNGDALAGVTRAEIVVTPDDVPVLMLRLVHFKVVGGVLPFGTGAHRNGEPIRTT
ncbi:hypothetical protein CR51_27320 [Caballeronia megalochromosomata]|nr:hypothetical protein CR51_27320 [Caballeronia megalochromosomata]